MGSTSSEACGLIQSSHLGSIHMRSTHHLNSEISNFTCTFTITQLAYFFPTNRKCVCVCVCVCGWVGIGVFYTSDHVKGCILHQHSWCILHQYDSDHLQCVWVCVCVCVYVYIYVCIYIYISIHRYIYIYIYVCLSVSMSMCL